MEKNLIENQEQNKEVISMENTTIENQEAEKELIQIGETVVDINKYKTKIEQLSNLFATLKVPYNDLKVLSDETPELKLVDDFFKSISCKNTGIEILLYEMIGYSLAKTAKLNKAFLLKRNWSKWQISTVPYH